MRHRALRPQAQDREALGVGKTLLHCTTHARFLEILLRFLAQFFCKSFRSFKFRSFEFVSDFGFRASDLVAATLRCVSVAKILFLTGLMSDNMTEAVSKRTDIVLKSLIAVIVAATYFQVVGHGFINYDDPLYVTENNHVSAGLTLKGIWWALTAFQAANWHPITWLSHMVDAQLFGMNPAGHHLTSVFFHVANTLLLFFLFQSSSRSFWKSFALASFFGLHPLHVESVAWVAERKDVLSTLFWLLTMLAYDRYAVRTK